MDGVIPGQEHSPSIVQVHQGYIWHWGRDPLILFFLLFRSVVLNLIVRVWEKKKKGSLKPPLECGPSNVD